MTVRWWIACIGTVAGWVVLGVGAALAAALVPVTVSPAGAPPIGLSIVDLSGTDVTNTYLPEVTVDAAGNVTGKIVTLQVIGLASPSISLQASTAYPGTCTNFSAPRAAGQASSDTNADGTPSPDFTFNPATNQLISLDCGGTATILVSGGGAAYTFKVPQDLNNNGIADSFEAAFGGNLDAAADPDGDGLASFDEYRGFIVSGKVERGNPTKKDLFVFLVNAQTNGISLPTGPSLLGKLPTENRTVYPTDGTALNADINNLGPVAQVHLLGQKRDAAGNLIFDGTNRNTTEMVDRLASFAVVTGNETWVYRTTDAPTPTITVNKLNRKSTPTDDRVINKNRRRFDLESPARTLLPPQKAVRIIESLDVSKTTPIGSSTWGSPDGLNEAIMYTQRIVNYIRTAAPATETRVWYSTFNGTAWTPYVSTFTVPGTTTSLTIDRNYIISKLVQQVFAHEGGGHDTRLTLTATTLGFHDPAGTGGMMDSQIQIITTTDNTAANPPGIKFRIPSIFLSGHLSGVQVAP